MPSGSRIWSDDLVIAALLSLSAGFADAVGYVNSGIFAANMTGNTVLAGLSLAEGKWDIALERGATLAAFCLGVVVGSLLLRLGRGRSAAPLVAEAALVVAAASIETRMTISIALIAVAMGMQAVAVTRFRSIIASTVVVTTSMARLSEFGLAWCIARPEARAGAPKIGPSLLAAIWASYGIGAIAAGYMLPLIARPLIAPAVIIVLVALILVSRDA
jgi:uncharacterized membrane protein YoaK (UPF0700 family)